MLKHCQIVFLFLSRFLPEMLGIHTKMGTLRAAKTVQMVFSTFANQNRIRIDDKLMIITISMLLCLPVLFSHTHKTKSVGDK